MTDEKNQETKKIVLAEDDKFISRAYKDGLQRAGFQVFTAFDGQTALDIIKKEVPNILLLDLIMPVKNGFDVLEEVQNDPELKKIPVLILSNLGQDSDVKKGKELGAVDYLIKSNFSMKEIISKVNSCIK